MAVSGGCSLCLFLSEWPGQRRALKDGKLLIPADNAGNKGGRPPQLRSGPIKESIYEFATVVAPCPDPV